MKLLLVTFGLLVGFVAEIALAKVEVQQVRMDASGRIIGIGIDYLGVQQPHFPPPQGTYENVIFELDPVSGAMKELVRLKLDFHSDFSIDPMGTKAMLRRTSYDSSKVDLMVIDLKTGNFTLTPLK